MMQIFPSITGGDGAERKEANSTARCTVSSRMKPIKMEVVAMEWEFVTSVGDYSGPNRPMDAIALWPRLSLRGRLLAQHRFCLAFLMRFTPLHCNTHDKGDKKDQEWLLF